MATGEREEQVVVAVIARAADGEHSKALLRRRERFGICWYRGWCIHRRCFRIENQIGGEVHVAATTTTTRRLLLGQPCARLGLARREAEQVARLEADALAVEGDAEAVGGADAAVGGYAEDGGGPDDGESALLPCTTSPCCCGSAP